MRKHMRLIVRILAVLALVAMAQMAGSSLAQLSGRDYARCIRTCDAVRKNCQAICKTDCEALYGKGTPQFTACVVACNAVCATESDQCKYICEYGEEPSPDCP